MQIKSQASIDFKIVLVLTEQEARALEALTVYGTKQFLDCFYTHLGEVYLKPNQKGLESLFETVKNELPKHLDKASQAREVFENK